MTHVVYEAGSLRFESAWGGLKEGRVLDVFWDVRVSLAPTQDHLVGRRLTVDEVDELILNLLRWRLNRHKQALPPAKETD